MRMKALTDEESDAIEQQFPVYVHGMLKTEWFSGALRPDETVGKITLTVPAERRAEQSRLEVRYSPTLAGAMVDALPYLVDYPYGCTEQTLNRFLPTVITQKVLIDMGLGSQEDSGKANAILNAQEIGDDQAAGRAVEAVRSQSGLRPRRSHADGARRRAAAHRNAAFRRRLGVVQRLGQSKAIRTRRPSSCTAWKSPSKTTWRWSPACWSAASIGSKHYQEPQVELLKNALTKPKPKEPYKDASRRYSMPWSTWCWSTPASTTTRCATFCIATAIKLSVYSKAMFGLALQKTGRKDELDNDSQQFAAVCRRGRENQTAYLKLPAENRWWFWYGSETEANAYYLKLLAKTDPQRPTGIAAGEVSAQQSPARHLLE